MRWQVGEKRMQEQAKKFDDFSQLMVGLWFSSLHSFTCVLSVCCFLCFFASLLFLLTNSHFPFNHNVRSIIKFLSWTCTTFPGSYGGGILACKQMTWLIIITRLITLSFFLKKVVYLLFHPFPSFNGLSWKVFFSLLSQKIFTFMLNFMLKFKATYGIQLLLNYQVSSSLLLLLVSFISFHLFLRY